MIRFTFISPGLVALLLFAGAAQDACAQTGRVFRGGLQVGLSAERSSYSWPDGQDSRTSVAVDARQNGFFGALLEFPLTPALLLEFGPHYGQRNVPIATLQRRGGAQFSIRQDPVDYLSLPVVARYLFVREGLVLPYAGAGLVFGMNLSALTVTVEELQFSDEPPFSTTRSTQRNLNQLFGAVLAEAGLDIRASEDWSVLLGVSVAQELTPLIDDALLTWETPHRWNVRFALLYSFGGGR